MKLSYKDNYELLKELRKINFQNPSQALAEIAILEKDKKYDHDYGFRAVVNMERISALRFLGRLNDFIGYLDVTISDAIKSKDDNLLLEAYSRLGSAFSIISQLDQAAYIYTQIIKLEKKYDRPSNKSAVAYNNLAYLFYEYGDYEKADKYYLSATNTLSQQDEDSYDFHTLKVFIYSNYADLKFKQNKIDEGEKLLKEVEDTLKYDIAAVSHIAYQDSLMLYYSHTADFETTYQQYKTLVKMLQETKNYINLVRVMQEFYEICQRKKVNLAIPIQHIREILKETPIEDVNYEKLHSIYSYLINYYIENQDNEMAIETYKQLEKLSDDYKLRLKTQQLNSINARIDMAENTEYTEKVKEKNEELIKLNQKYLEQSQMLNETLNKLNLISWMGQKLVSSKSYDDLIKNIQQELQKVMNYDLFALLKKDEEHNSLSANVLYNEQQVQEYFSVDIDNPDSLIAKSYREKALIFSNNIQNDDLVVKKKIEINADKPDTHSVIFFPLEKDEQVLAVLTLQSYKTNAYTQSDIDFLNSLAPFLIIAIVNSSNADKLERLSNVDELTKIYNRRFFYKKYTDLIDKAQINNQAAFCFMIDIDYFKLYNDNYGHLKGDEALVQVAKTIASLFNDKNTICARYGGEEFIALSIGNSEKDAYTIAEQLREDIYNLAIEHEVTERKFLTVSVGLSQLDSKSKFHKENLIQLADDCLYAAKNSGRNKVVAARLI